MSARDLVTRMLWLLLLAAALTGSQIAQAQTQRAIPEDNLSYPVLITLKNANDLSVGFGSGFYLNTDDAVYLVTAKHVLAAALPNPITQQIEVPDASLELLSYSKDVPPQRILLSLKLSAVSQTGAVKIHSFQDVVVLKIAMIAEAGAGGVIDKRKIAGVPGVIAKEMAESGLLGVSMEAVKKFDQVLVGNDAILYGYPVSLALRKNALFDAFHLLLRRALIAGKDVQQRSIIIDGAVYRGNSGGPVFEIDHEPFQTRFYLIGVLTDFVPLVEGTDDFVFQLNSGYSVARSMDFVLELIK